MVHVFPFRAVSPPAERAHRVVNPPYDVVTAEEARGIISENPLGFLRVGRADSELPDHVDQYDQQVYDKALENYNHLRMEVPLRAESEPAFYVYALEMDGYTQAGIVATVAVDDYDSGAIRRHENTRPGKEDDRTRHIITLRAQTGPVFLMYRESERLDRALASVVSGEPRFDFTAADGVRHTGWKVPDELTEEVSSAFLSLTSLYIADGHHRAASASRVRELCRKENPDHSGDESYNRFLSVIFPAGQLRILPYNRLVADLNDLTCEQLLEKSKESFEVSAVDAAKPDRPERINMYLEGRWWQLRCKLDLEDLSPAERLDVSLLQNLLLEPMLGIADPRTSKRIEFVGGIRGTGALESAVDSGKFAVAFSMFPTTVEQLMSTSDAGEIMPPKSTWFEPKPGDGLFVHDI